MHSSASAAIEQQAVKNLSVCRCHTPRPEGPFQLLVPFNKAQGPSYWEDRLNDHYAQLGITLTEAFHRQVHGYLVRVQEQGQSTGRSTTLQTWRSRVVFTAKRQG